MNPPRQLSNIPVDSLHEHAVFHPDPPPPSPTLFDFVSPDIFPRQPSNRLSTETRPFAPTHPSHVTSVTAAGIGDKPNSQNPNYVTDQTIDLPSSNSALGLSALPSHREQDYEYPHVPPPVSMFQSFTPVSSRSPPISHTRHPSQHPTVARTVSTVALNPSLDMAPVPIATSAFAHHPHPPAENIPSASMKLQHDTSCPSIGPSASAALLPPAIPVQKSHNRQGLVQVSEEPAKQIEVVTIESDSDDDVTSTDLKRPLPMPGCPVTAKRPRSTLPDVIDLDDTEIMAKLERMAPKLSQQQWVPYTAPVPMAGAAILGRVEGGKQLHVSRGGGLFSVDGTGTVEIVDSDDEAERTTTHKVDEKGNCLAGSVSTNDNKMLDTTATDKEVYGRALNFRVPQEEELGMAPDGLERKGAKRAMKFTPPVMTPVLQAGKAVVEALNERLHGIVGGSFNGRHVPRLSGALPIAPPTMYVSDATSGGTERVEAAANTSGIVSGNESNRILFEPASDSSSEKLEMNIPNCKEKGDGKDGVAPPVAAGPVNAEPYTKMQISNGENVRPQFVAIASPGAGPSASHSEPPTVLLDLSAGRPSSGFTRKAFQEDGEGLSAHELRNLVKQNMLTADATEEAATPPELSVQLMPHQKRALAWMAKRELPMHSDEDIVAVDEECLGGILADDQGLGKTLSMIALIVKNSSSEEESVSEKDGYGSSDESVSSRDFIDDSSLVELDTGSKTNGPWRTLIVCPLSVINQWKEEIESKIKRHYLPKIYIYHGPRREQSSHRLRKYDIVITTYATLVNEYPKILKDHPDYDMRKSAKMELPRRSPGAVCQVTWRRIVLDESQFIKNRGTDTWSAVMSLSAERRWCLSGTPIQNCVDDLYSLFCFIRYRFVPNYETWNVRWKKQLEHQIPSRRMRAFKRFQAIAGVVLLRRTKKDTINGKPLIKLPPRIATISHQGFADKEEAQVYQAVAEKTVLEMNKYIVNGTFNMNYSSVLLLLLRLRQACSHPFLIEYARMQGGYAKTQQLNQDYMTLYTAEELDEALELYSSGHSLLALVDESQRDNVSRYFAPAKQGTHVTTSFRCSYCFEVSRWIDGWVLGCGEVFCSKCRALVVEKKGCRRCRHSIAGIDPVEAIINADHMRREVHARVMLGDANTNVTAAEFKVLLEEELDRRRSGRPEIRNEVDGEIAGVVNSTPTVSRAQRRSEVGKRRLVAAFSQHSTKIRKVIEELDNVRRRGEGEKTLIFSQWTSMLDIIEFNLKMEGYGICRLDGSMQLATRQQQIKQFREKPEKTVFLISLHAGGTGLNLTASNRVILTDVWWNPAVEEQAIDRVHRIGQTKPVHVTRFKMEGTVEERIYQLCEKKRQTAQGTLGEGKQNYGRMKLSQQEIMSLFSGTAEDVIRNAGSGTAAAQAASNLLNFSSRRK